MSASSLNFPSQFSVGAEDVIMRDEPVQTSVPTLEVASPVPTRGKRSITEEHWKWLQPIVSHFYIEENLTFHQIQTKLKLDYDFYLSRRTFTKKIDKWGLKKNIRRKERNELLKLGQNHEKFKGDHRLRDEARLKRLRKRYNGDSSLLGQCNSSHSNDMDTDEVEGTTTTIQSQQLHQNDPLPNTANLDDETQFNNDDDVEEIMPQCSEINSSASNQWVEPTTVSVDELVVSLATLGIQVSSELLKRRANPAKDEDSDSDSDTEQQQPLGASCARASGTESYSTQAYRVQVGRSSRNVLNKRTRTFNPYAEMSVFPARPKKASRITWDVFVAKVKREWPMEMKRLESKLRSPTLCNKERISTLDGLISFQNEMNFDSARTYEALLRALKSEPERDRSRISKAYLKSIEGHIRVYRLQEAQKLFRKYRNEFNEKPKFTNPELLYLQAYYLYNLGHYHKAENILRPLICFALTQFGPFNYFTMLLLHLYNCIIQQQRLQGEFVEFENIRRFSLSVCSGEEADFNFRLWSPNAFSLLSYFIDDGRYEEAQSLCSYLMKRTQSAFGNESPLYIECQILQARIWYKQGKFKEALDLSYQLSNNPKLSKTLKFNLFFQIDYILWEKGDFSEAAIWSRKIVEARVILCGLQHPYVLIDCRNLGLCYERLGQWGAALRLYSSFLGRLRKCWGVEESSVKEVERWISFVEQEMERIAQESENGGESEIKSDSESENGGESAIESESEKESEVENESERDENAKEGAGIEGVEDMGLDQDQTGDSFDEIDWKALHAESPSAFYGYGEC